ncbi:MAG: hypothetical protein ACRD5H_09215, partial [Nitrososphaerales archaeon]
GGSGLEGAFKSMITKLRNVAEEGSHESRAGALESSGRIGDSILARAGYKPRLDLSKFAGPFQVRKAQSGMNAIVNQPTLILAGEAGEEHVRITPGSRNRGGSTTSPIIIMNIAGSVLSENMLHDLIDKYLQRELRLRNFGT